MGKITDENRRELLSAKRYEDAELKGMDTQPFTDALCQLIEEKKIPILSIVENTNISKSYINKLRNPSIKTVHPARHVIIDIALAVNASLDETNQLLKLARYQELYTRDAAESFIIWGMLNKLPGAEIRRMLQEKGLDSIFR